MTPYETEFAYEYRLPSGISICGLCHANSLCEATEEALTEARNEGATRLTLTRSSYYDLDHLLVGK